MLYKKIQKGYTITINVDLTFIVIHDMMILNDLMVIRGKRPFDNY